MLRLGRRLRTPLLVVRCLMVLVVIVRMLMSLLLRRGIRLMGVMLLLLLTVKVARLIARGFADRDNITDSRLEFSFDEILHDRWNFLLWL